MSSDVYSPALAVAIGASAVSLAAALLTRRFRVGLWASLVAIVMVSVAVASHVRVGHSAGSASALGFLAFIRAHPAIAITTGAAVVALLLLERGRRASKAG